jgi:predicted N-acetyltransferase YhbS
MFKVKSLTRADFGFAAELANTMDWNTAAEDFIFMDSLEPGGSFLLMDDSKRIGIATCISYGKVGWFGNLIVEKTSRRKGAGRMLVQHALDYLHTKGVETVGLFAYPQLKEFYSHLGFKPDIDFALLHADKIFPVETAGAHKINETNLAKIAVFDSHFFGGDRTRLLESIVFDDSNAGYYVSDRGHVVGYVAATIYESMAWIGPLICVPSRYDVAGKLVSAVLSKVGGKSVFSVVAKSDVAMLGMLSSVGFKEEFAVSRMFLGISEAKNCIYLAESLERG